MKISKILCIILAVFQCSFFSNAFAEEQNDFSDMYFGSFETGTVEGIYGNNASAEFVSGGAGASAGAVKITQKTGGTGADGFRKNVSIDPNKDYKLSMKVKLLTDGKSMTDITPLFTLYQYGVNAQYISMYVSELSEDGWYYIESNEAFNFNTKYALTESGSINAMLDFRVGGAELTYLVDDVFLRTWNIEGEENKRGWYFNPSSNKYINMDNLNSTLTLDKTNNALNIKSNGNSPGPGVRVKYNFELDKTYRTSFLIKPVSGDLKSVKFGSKTADSITEEKDGWYKVTKMFKETGNVCGEAERQRLWIWINQSNFLTSDEFLVDNITIEKINSVDVSPKVNASGIYDGAFDGEYVYAVTDNQTVVMYDMEGNTVKTAVMPEGDDNLALETEIRTNYNKLVTVSDKKVCALLYSFTDPNGNSVNRRFACAFIDFNEETPVIKLLKFYSGSIAGVLQYKNGYFFCSYGAQLRIYKEEDVISALNDGYNGYITDNNSIPYVAAKLNSPENLYTLDFDWDNDSENGRFVVITHNPKPSGSNALSKNLRMFLGSINVAEDNTVEFTVDDRIDLYTIISGYAEGFMGTQCVFRGDKLFVVSRDNVADGRSVMAADDRAMYVFDITGNKAVLEKKLNMKDFGDESTYISSIAPFGKYMAVFTSNGRFINDNQYSCGTENYLYIINVNSNDGIMAKTEMPARPFGAVTVNDKIYVSLMYTNAMKSAGASKGYGFACIGLPQEAYGLGASISGSFYTERVLKGEAEGNIKNSKYFYCFETSDDGFNWTSVKSGISTDTYTEYTPGVSESGKYIRYTIISEDYKYSKSDTYQISANEFSVGTIRITDANGVGVSNVGAGTLTAYADVYNPEETEKKIIMYMAVYNSLTDSLDYVQKKDFTANKGISTVSDTIELENLSDYSAYTRYLKVFIWDSSMKAMTESCKINEVELVEGSTWDLYIPENSETVDGLILINRHGMGGTLADMAAFRSFCADRNLAVMSFFDDAGVLKNFTDKETANTAIMNKINEYAVKTGHEELNTVPLATFGHSNATGFSAGFAEYNPDRVFASIIYKPANDKKFYYESFGECNIPLFVITGEEDWGYGYNDQIYACEKLLDKGALVQYIQDPGAGHFWNAYKSNTIMFKFLDKAYSLKVKNAEKVDDGSIVMNQIDKTSGYIGYGEYTVIENTQSTSGYSYKYIPTGYMTYEEYISKKAEDPEFKAQAWLFDEEYAQDWVEFNKNGIIEVDYSYMD